MFLDQGWGYNGVHECESSRLGKYGYLIGEREVFIEDETEITNTSRVGSAERAVLYIG